MKKLFSVFLASLLLLQLSLFALAVSLSVQDVLANVVSGMVILIAACRSSTM